MVKALAILIICCFYIGLPTHAGAVSNADREYSIKAAYIFNLIKFIEWPSGTVSQPKEADIELCSFDNSPISMDIMALDGRTANQQNISVQLLAINQPLPTSCDLVFISNNNNMLAKSLNLNNEEFSSILTVGENDDFIKNDGLVALVLIDNHIHLKINLKKAKQRQFKISGKLLEIADIIE